MSSHRRKRIIIFSLLLLATVGLATFLIVTLWQKEEYRGTEKGAHIIQASLSPVPYNTLLADNELLNSRLNALQQLDQQYSRLLTESNNKKSLDSINQQIYVQEEIFRGSIDSVFLNEPLHEDSGLNKLFNNIISPYKLILQNRTALSSLRNAVNMNKNNLNPDEMAMLRTQNEVQEKNNRIASLESTLKAMSANKGNKIPQPASGENENVTALKENIVAQEKTISGLIDANNNLKQDYEKLLKQQNDATRNASSGDLSVKNKTIVLQQKIDELNAELRLAQVDCNLSRVDAGQIISNSRQRKELLSEASGILTSLAKSDDADIRKKVQDKIARLNQVAANSRD